MVTVSTLCCLALGSCSWRRNCSGCALCGRALGALAGLLFCGLRGFPFCELGNRVYVARRRNFGYIWRGNSPMLTAVAVVDCHLPADFPYFLGIISLFKSTILRTYFSGYILYIVRRVCKSIF